MRRSNTPSGQGCQLSKGMTRCVMSDDAFRVPAFHPFLPLGQTIDCRLG